MTKQCRLKWICILISSFILVPGIENFAQESTTTHGKEIARGTINLSEVAKKSARTPKKIMKESLEETFIPPFMPIPFEKEIRGKVVHEDATRVDSQTIKGQQAPSGKGNVIMGANNPVTLSPAPSANFQASDDPNVTIPPDTHGAAGPNHLMVVHNPRVRIQDKVGNNLSTVTLNTFWSTVNGGSGAFDPKVIYDPYNSRWIFVACDDAQSASSGVLIGVTATNDPTGVWYLFKVDADPADLLWADYPSIGFNKDWIVVQMNMFTMANAFTQTQIYVFKKADLYGNVGATNTLITSATIGATQVPAVTYDNSISTLYLLQDWNGNSGGSGFIRLYTITGAIGSEVLTAVTLISTPNPWDDVSPGFSDYAPQLGDPRLIMNNDARMQNVVYRNGSLWCTHTIFLPAGGSPTRSAVQWWQVTTAGAITQRGRIDDATATLFHAFPSIAVNSSNDALIGYSQFSAGQYASANYSYRASTDAANTMQTDYKYKAGVDSYNKDYGAGKNRWGDYSATCVDPSNDATFWTIQEYAETKVSTGNGSGRWGTWWAKVDPPWLCTITCPSNIVQANDVGQCSAIVNYSAPQTTGTCGTVTCTPASGSSFPVITTTVNCTTTAGPSCSFTVTVNDTQAPTITCPANITTNTAPNICSAVVTFTATATDNCTTPALPPVTCNPPSGSTFPKGVTTVTCTARDWSNNQSSCQFTVTVNDTQAPNITCPANIVKNTDPNLCTAVTTWAAPVVSDNCPGVGAPTCVPASGTAFPKGVTTVTCSVADASGNTRTCSFTVTVNDVQPPSITCPANISLESDATCNGITVNYPAPTVTDNCPGVTYTCTPASGSYFPAGNPIASTTVTCTARDASNNTATCSFTVTVEKRPVISPAGNPVAIRFGCKQSSSLYKSIVINNTGGHFGGGVLAWTAATSASEITLLTTSGNEGQVLKFTVNPSGLAFGQYTRTITITGKNSVTNNAACNSPYTLTVIIDVEPMVPFTKTLAVGTTFTMFANSYGTPVAEVKSNTTPITSFTVNMTPCTYPQGLARLRYVKRYFTFSTNATSPNVDLKLYWSSSERIGITKPGLLQAYQQVLAGGPWNNRGGVADTIMNVVTTTGQTNIDGTWVIASVWYPKPLNIELISAMYDRSTRNSVIQFKSNLVPNEQGFYIERAYGSADTEFETVGSVTYNTDHEYGFSERLVNEGTYYYRIYTIDGDGQGYESGIFSIKVGSQPIQYALDQNYPNPFSAGSYGNPSTTIKYQIAEPVHAILKVYDVLMREVTTLVDEEKAAGKHSVQLDATNLPSGVYFYRLDAGKFSQTKRMILTK